MLVSGGAGSKAAADDGALRALVDELAERCAAAAAGVATAESCTGGWIAKAITDRAGSSAWFRGGLVAYSNALKERLLGVPGELIEAHGAVSEPVALAMARGALAATGASAAVAVTGIAGPEGGSTDKPVGTVWLAWAGSARGPRAERHRFGGDREAVRRAAVAAALEGLIAEVGAGGPA